MNRTQWKKKFASYAFYIRHTLLPILVFGVAIGLVTGVVIWGYAFVVEFLGAHSAEIYRYVQGHPAFIPLLFAGLLALATLSWLLARLVPEVAGSGLPYAEGVMRGLLPLKWLKTALAMIASSFVSFFAGLPLGSEGPSVLIGSCIGDGINNLGGKKKQSRYAWRRQSITGGAAAGFAVAFNAPLAGIVFALEEGHKRFSPMILLPAAASVITGTITANILTYFSGHGIASVVFTQFSAVADPTFRELGYLSLLGLAVGVFAAAFSLALNHASNLIAKIRINAWFKIAAAFILTGIAGLITVDAIGGGTGVIKKIALMGFEWKALLLLIVVKLILVVFCSSNSVTGGLFIPILAIGALFGGLMARLFVLMGMDEQYTGMIVIISMCAFLGGVMRSPVTAVVLIIELTDKLTASLWATCLVILFAYFITELFKIEPIYDNALGNLMKKRNAGKRKKLVEFEVEAELGSFAVGRSVRDILWPANALVIKVKNTDADGNIIYRMDDDGERKIHAGDKFIIQAETADYYETYRQILYIIRKPDNIPDAVLPPPDTPLTDMPFTAPHADPPPAGE